MARTAQRGAPRGSAKRLGTALVAAWLLALLGQGCMEDSGIEQRPLKRMRTSGDGKARTTTVPDKTGGLVTGQTNRTSSDSVDVPVDPNDSLVDLDPMTTMEDSEPLSDDPAAIPPEGGAKPPPEGSGTPQPTPAPQASPAKRFVMALYADLLGRGLDAGGEGFWVGQLQQGASRHQVALGIFNSDEARLKWLRDWSAIYFVRDLSVDPGWVAAFRASSPRTWQQNVKGWISSPEFYAASGSTPNGFVDQAYWHVLGRAPDPGGLQFFRSKPRDQAADLMIHSDEAANRISARWYLQYLGRPADPGGLTYWGGRIKNGNYAEVLADMLASDEYFARAQVR